MNKEQTLQQAIIHQKAGELQEAEQLYRAILNDEPKHPNANYNLGVLLNQNGQFEAALRVLKIALETNPNQGQFWISYIDTLIHLGQLDVARNVLDQVQSKGLKGDAINQLATCLNSQSGKILPATATAKSKKKIKPEQLLARAKSHVKNGKFEEAGKLYTKVLEADPQNQQAKKGLKALQSGNTSKKNQLSPPQAQIDSVITFYTNGQIQEALNASEIIIKNYPNEALFYNISGICYSYLNQLGAAVKSYEKALAIKPDYSEAHYNLGNTLKELGQLDAVVKHFEQALVINPTFTEAHSNLGNTLKELGQLDAAVKCYEQALALKPDYAEAHSNLGNTLKELGQLDAAVKRYEKALAIKPDFVEAHNNLGMTLKELGQLDAAVKRYEKALTIKPDYAEAHNSLGIALNDLGHLSLAVKSYQRALAIKSDYAEAHYNLGIALHNLEQLDAAVKSYERALAIKPDYAKAHNNLGNTLKELGQLDAAVKSYERALAIKLDYAEAHYNLGIALHNLGQLDAAVKSYERTLTIKPDYAEAHSNLGITLNDLGHLGLAVKSYERALAIKLDYAEAHYNLGIALHNLGQLDAAVKSYEHALETKPDYTFTARLILPIIPISNDHIDQWRDRYITAIKALKSTILILNDPFEISPNSFYLAYHNYNNKACMEALCELFRRKNNLLSFCGPNLGSTLNLKKNNSHIRIGFVSQYFYNHTIGKLYQGLIQNLNRNHFEVILIHTSDTKKDSFRQTMDSFANKVVTLPKALSSQHETLTELTLDVLFYTDIGMSPKTYFLAFSRLAPIQITSWGHPDTSGLKTIDYFLSSNLIEPNQPQDNYSEQLICLNRLPCFYPPIKKQIITSTREAFNLPKQGTLYGCPQSLFKIHPDFDCILNEIITKDPEGHIILLEGKTPAWTQLLKQRWKKKYPNLLNNVIFLPRQPHEKFMSLMQHFDVLLDPIYFGSGNTMYEAINIGKPYITWPSQFMRSRVVSGAYQQMKIPAPPIASKLKDYASLAVKLGKDYDQRRTLIANTLERKHLLFSDNLVLHEFEDFLHSAVKSARLNIKLPINWKPKNNE